jgi:hypothetical protein
MIDFVENLSKIFITNVSLVNSNHHNVNKFINFFISFISNIMKLPVVDKLNELYIRKFLVILF